MLGRYRHGVAYYVCQASRRQTTLLAPGHPRMVYLREDRAVEKVLHFLQSHLFGPGRREALAQALEATDPEKDEHQGDVDRLRGEVADLGRRIRRQMENLEAVEADTSAAAEIRSRLRELASIKSRRERELEVAERALSAPADSERARQLVDLLPLIDVDAALLAERSFRELLAALDFAASFSPDQKELRVRAVLAPEFVSARADGMSALSLVPPAGIGPATPGLGNLCSIH
jgi:site-specific DNA recombinase